MESKTCEGKLFGKLSLEKPMGHWVEEVQPQILAYTPLYHIG